MELTAKYGDGLIKAHIAQVAEALTGLVGDPDRRVREGYRHYVCGHGTGQSSGGGSSSSSSSGSKQGHLRINELLQNPALRHVFYIQLRSALSNLSREVQLDALLLTLAYFGRKIFFDLFAVLDLVLSVASSLQQQGGGSGTGGGGGSRAALSILSRAVVTSEFEKTAQQAREKRREELELSGKNKGEDVDMEAVEEVAGAKDNNGDDMEVEPKSVREVL